ncbi:MAG: cation/multidrug efflux pump [Gammaproteobacteria bacterium]
MTLEIITIITAIFGVLLFILAIKRLARRKMITGSFQGLSGLLLLSLAALSGSTALNLYTYQQLTQEESIADIQFSMLEPKLFRAFITYPNKDTQTYDLRGDQWQLDARILKWSGIATLAGMKTHYRLERISGRYNTIKNERTAPRTVYPLASSNLITNWSPDVWSFIKGNQEWFPWVDAIYGSATYLPMIHRARYTIYVSTSGLITRPSNSEAVNAVQNWK